MTDPKADLAVFLMQLRLFPDIAAYVHEMSPGPWRWIDDEDTEIVALTGGEEDPILYPRLKVSKQHPGRVIAGFQLGGAESRQAANRSFLERGPSDLQRLLEHAAEMTARLETIFELAKKIDENPELQKVVSRWRRLPSAVRKTILLLSRQRVRTTEKQEVTNEQPDSPDEEECFGTFVSEDDHVPANLVEPREGQSDESI